MAAQTTLEILIQAVDNATTQLENVANGLDATGQKAISAQQQLQQYGQALTTAGLQLTVAGAAIDAFYGSVVAAAAGTQEAQDSLATSVKDVVDAAQSGSTSQAALATQVTFLTDKINSEKATIAEATATLDKNSGSAASVAASHQKAAATIATAQANIQKYQQQLDLLTASEGLAGASAEAIVSQFEDTARASTDLGFSISDSESSLKNLFAATKSAPDALTAYQTAMDLARAKQEDLGTATQQVVMAMQGQGRALIGVGINIKDGLSGMDALAAIQTVVGGQAQAFSNTLGGQMAIALQNLNKLLTDMGNTQLPLLTSLFEMINKVITAIDNWINAHPKLTEIILVFIGVAGALITILGTIMLVAGAVALAIAGGLSAAFIGIGAAVAVGVAALVALGVAIVTNWNYIKDNFLAAWQLLETGWNVFWSVVKNVALDAFNWLLQFFGLNLGEIQATWNAVWTGVETFFTGIWDNIKSALSSAITFLMGQLTTFVDWAKGILGFVLNPVQGISNLISGTVGLAKAAAGAATSVLNVHDAIITPSGQVIQSDPSDYLIATRTPGNLGGGGSVNITLSGNYFLDSNGARMIANEMAKQVGRQMKLRNYAV